VQTTLAWTQARTYIHRHVRTIFKVSLLLHWLVYSSCSYTVHPNSSYPSWQSHQVFLWTPLCPVPSTSLVIQCSVYQIWLSPISLPAYLCGIKAISFTQIPSCSLYKVVGGPDGTYYGLYDVYCFWLPEFLYFWSKFSQPDGFLWCQWQATLRPSNMEIEKYRFSTEIGFISETVETGPCYALTGRKSQVADRSMSVSITLSGLQRRNDGLPARISERTLTQFDSERPKAGC